MPISSQKWPVPARFRRGAYGWRGSQKAMKRLKEAVSEIKAVHRKDPVRAANGAALLLEKLVPAIMDIDSSSGALGGAVSRTVDTLATLMADAPLDVPDRMALVRRVQHAWQADEYGYLDALPDYWGTLCADEAVLRDAVGEMETLGIWNSSAYASCLYALGEHEKLVAFLEPERPGPWYIMKWGARALLALARPQEAMECAEECRRNPYTYDQTGPAEFIETVLRKTGQPDTAFMTIAIQANWKTTRLATFRAICKKYPAMDPEDILDHLVAHTPGEEGKWFAAAKSAGLLKRAAELAETSPTDHNTLLRAARDFADVEPVFARRVAVSALTWLAEGHGYEVLPGDVHMAFRTAAELSAATDWLHPFVEHVERLVAEGLAWNDMLKYSLQDIKPTT